MSSKRGMGEGSSRLQARDRPEYPRRYMPARSSPPQSPLLCRAGSQPDHANAAVVRSPLPGPDEAALISDDHGLGAVAEPQLGEHSGDVRFHRVLADDQSLGDLGVGEALGH